MYFTGENLKKKIEEYGLEELSNLLDAVMSGERAWPGQLALPADENLLERCRIAVYSLLHVKGVKHLFTVKLDLARSRLLIDSKASVKRKRPSGFIMVELPRATVPDIENPEIPSLED